MGIFYMERGERFMQEKINLAIIGGGASGLIAAITASKICKQTKQITIFEGASRVGKKLLATGNGRCNLTNIHASAKHYYGDTRLIEAILRTYPPQRVIQYFEEIGLLCKEESEGRIYPYSLQASSVLDVLRFNAEELQVEIICDCPIHNIQSKNGIFILENHQQQTFIADKVILATGGKASPQLGSAGNGYTLAKQLGHTVTPLYPALTILKTPPEYVKSLKGMRSHVTAILKCNGKAIRHEKGEVQFTEQGLSGICMFQFSCHVAHSIANKQKITILLDFMPEYSVSGIVNQLNHAVNLFPHLPATEILKGFMNKKVGETIVKTAVPQSKEMLAKQLTKTDFMAIANAVKQFSFPCIGVADWKQAQVTAGGVSLSQLNSSLESKIHKGLYFSGELLNIDGDCGGYNLNWAWISGITAGKAAAKSLCHKDKARISTT